MGGGKKMSINKYRYLNFLYRNSLVLNSIERSEGGSIASYKYSISGLWSKLFRKERLSIDFGVDIREVPDSVLVIPFLTNMLPVIWLCNAIAHVKSIDGAFSNSISAIKKGYENMYPCFNFLGEIKADSIEVNVPRNNIHDTAMFYSAGVDSFSTFLNHENEHPLLINICGSDISLDDTKGWNAMKRRQFFMKEHFGLDCVSICSNFKNVINPGRLSKLVERSGDNWWHGFQHGIAIIGHAAPLAYKFGIKKLYLASTYTPAVYGKITCASDPSIDNNVEFVQTRVYHDGDERDRFQKIRQIADFHHETGIVLPLHVCWESRGGENCSSCEKCTRTILALYACGEDPKDYGFNPELISESNVRRACKSKFDYENYYRRTVEALRKMDNEKTIEWWAKWALNFCIDD